MVKLLKVDESYTVNYTGTGEQEEILFEKKSGYPLNGTLRVEGGSSDVFSVKTKTGDTYKTEIDSVNGKIPVIPIFSKGKGILVEITSNISGNIELEVLL